MRGCTCDMCGNLFRVQQEDIKTEQISPDTGVERMFFSCPYCEKTFTILYTTPATRKMINERSTIAKAIKSQKGKKNMQFVARLKDRDKDLMYSIKDMSRTLKAAYED